MSAPIQTIAAKWAEFEAAAMGSELERGTISRDVARRIFYAGFACCYAMLSEAMEQAVATTDAVMEPLVEEFSHFVMEEARLADARARAARQDDAA